MRIVEYDEVDPIAVLGLNLTGLGYALTPQRVADIRRLDSRPFPCFALYADIDGIVAGQVGVFSLPVTTTEGEMEVGGLWAVCVDPAFRRQGIAGRLSDEAHERMTAAGLTISTLGTSRHLAAYSLYRQHGYVDGHISSWTMASAGEVDTTGALSATPAPSSDWHLIDTLFDSLSEDRLGFARRHPNFLAAAVAAGDVAEDDVWLIDHADKPVGYSIARPTGSVLSVRNLLVGREIDPAQAVAAIARKTRRPFIRVRVDSESIAASLLTAGYPPARHDWGTFMVKPLDPATSPSDAKCLLGVDSDRFMISSMDIT